MNNEAVRKLKIETYPNRLVLHKPDDVDDLSGLSFDTEITKDAYDMILIFVFSLDDFIEKRKQVIEKNLLDKDGVLYLAYPKKGNKRYTHYIGRDDFFIPEVMDEEGFAPNSSLKFVKMVSFNDTFTVLGLKHKKKTPTKSTEYDI